MTVDVEPGAGVEESHSECLLERMFSCLPSRNILKILKTLTAKSDRSKFRYFWRDDRPGQQPSDSNRSTSRPGKAWSLAGAPGLCAWLGSAGHWVSLHLAAQSLLAGHSPSAAPLSVTPIIPLCLLPPPLALERPSFPEGGLRWRRLQHNQPSPSSSDRNRRPGLRAAL